MPWDIVAERLLDFIKVLFNRKKPSDAIKDSIKIRILAEELVYSGLSIDCFFIVMAHNGNSKMKPHGFKYWSIIDGSYDELTMGKFKYTSYQNTIMDLEFAQLVNKIYEMKEVSLVTKYMPEGNLKTSYDYEELEYLKFFYLKQDRRAMWFIMVGTTAENESLESNQQKRNIFIAVNNVKNMLRFC